MSGLYRSEDMSYVRLIMNDASCYDTVRELGKLAKLHVIDMSLDNPASLASPDSSFTFYKKRIAICQSYERKFLTFKDAFEQYGVGGIDFNSQQTTDIRSSDIVEDCKNFIEPLESSFTKNVIFRKQHKQVINEQIEYIHVLTESMKSSFNMADAQAVDAFASERLSQASRVQSQSFHALEEKSSVDLEAARAHGASFYSSIYGVLPLDKLIAFERLLFRISRGNTVQYFFQIPDAIEDPASGDLVKKSVFQVIFAGQQLAKRISRIVSYLGGTEYPVPSRPEEISRLQNDLQQRLIEAQNILLVTDKEIQKLLYGLLHGDDAGQSAWMNWMAALHQEKVICDIMKRCDCENARSKMITMEAWIPTADLDALQSSLHAAVRFSQAKQAVLQILPAPVGKTPPTYFKTNAFTGSFQGIVNTYGVPRYKEVNPGVFTIISFPFLFGIMYGDIGHGTLLFAFALWLLINEKKYLELERRGQLSEIPSMVFGGRYLLVMMGAFALYAGTIYNEVFSIPVNLYGSRWEFDPITNISYQTGVYPYGIDPSWFHTTNELAFFNSFKMKLAVTLGVVQMVFGIVLGLMNDLYFKHYLEVAFEFVPRLLFILCTFGYMVFIIIFKFCILPSPGTPSPLLIQTMIQMFLSPGSVESDKLLYDGQGVIQAILLLVAVFSIPLMLFPIPCITNSRYKKRMALEKHPDDTVNTKSIQLKVDDDGNPLPPTSFPLTFPTSDVNLNERLLEGRLLDSPRSVDGVGIFVDDTEQKNGDYVPPAYPVSPSSQSSSSDSAAAAPAASHGGGHGGHGEDGEYNYSDHMIIQGIHTIEFVLGTVSNTASYLRLWALSLAHSELSQVFWDKMIMQYGVENSNPVFSFVGFAVWFVATFAVLLCMDVLECFLHALRLHWVEFQNKFFHADGIAYEPFTFEKEKESS